ncbi:MAG: lipoprotein insertase outer membrane protein LolB [bacterium]
MAKSLILNSILLILLLAGCAARAPEPSSDLHFQILGKIGVKQDGEGFSANFDWRQHSQARYEIDVWGPLGQGRTQLEGDAQTMQISRGEQLLALGQPEEVMLMHLGWSIPLDVLPAWIRGQPAAQLRYGNSRLDEQGRYVEFTQAGWLVSLARYNEHGGITTPGRIRASRADKTITVVVREYLP